MAPGFSFPPPPPPPKPSAPTYIPDSSRGNYGDGGRGRGRSSFRGGRGSYNSDNTLSNYITTPHTNPSPAGSFVNPHFQNDPRHTQRAASYRPQPASVGTPQSAQGQKRKRDDHAGSWRGDHNHSQRNRQHSMKQSAARPKSAVAPAVPSFGAPIPFPKTTLPNVIASTSSLEPEESHSVAESDQLPPPFADDSHESESEDDDADEEAAFRAASGGRLKFEHNGEIIVLESAADMQAWFQERQRRFPTLSRIEQKQIERQARMDERRRIEAETAAAMGYAPRYPPVMRSPVYDKAANPTAGRDEATSSRAEQLRAQLLDQKRAKQGNSTDNEAARDQQESHSGHETTTNTTPALGLLGYASSDDEGSPSASEAPSPEVAAQLEPAGQDADSESDSSPEVQSSKTVPTLPKVVPSAPPDTTRQLDPCHFFAQQGRCRHGARCKFQHVRGRGVTGTDRFGRRGRESRKTERKTLYQRLLEQEQLAENKLALQAIKYLGDAGFFKPKSEEEK
ncbi:hypothetical protein ANO11243_089810 [Dothideomycetidae sp. 11243]|nr:hypothetical protein ANO11243_089810 [fungal sp. No.11243]